MMEDLNYLMKQIKLLLGDDSSYSMELHILKGAYRRYLVRFRNCQTTSKIKRVVSLNRKFHGGNYLSLIEQYLKQLGKAKGKSEKMKAKTILLLILDMAKLSDLIIEHTMYAYIKMQAHIKVGHLIFHYITLSSVLSRISIIFKALLIYLSDLYQMICATYIDGCDKLKEKNLNHLLEKHDCKPRNLDCSSTKRPTNDTNTEDFGVVINREQLKIKKM